MKKKNRFNETLFKISPYCYLRIEYKIKTKHIGIYLNIHKRNKMQEKIVHKQARHILHELKINGCIICGYNKCDDALEFHHINPKDKKFNLNATSCANNNGDKIATELNKCILLCANCHREIERRNEDAKQ